MIKKVSELLKEERERRGYTLDDIQRATRIKKNFLIAIEEGKFHRLPSESYALGFVKNYASVLGLSQSRVIPLFRREYHQKDEEEEISLPRYRHQPYSLGKKIVISPKVILVTVMCLIIVGYIMFQYHSLFIGPQITISTPTQNQVVKETIIEVEGKTSDPYGDVFIDGEKALIGLDGKFQKSLYVFPGERKIKVVAQNKFGKRTEKVVVVKVE